MSYNRIILVVVLVVIGVGTVVFLRQLSSPLPSSSSQITVATTIFPLADIIRHIGGDTVSVITLLQPGLSEHDITLKPEQVASLASTEALFMIGHHADTTLVDKVSAVYPQLPIIPVDTGITLRPFAADQEDEDHEEAGSLDPHYWLTVPNAERIAQTVADTLSTLHPKQASVYTQNLQTYTNELQALETELQHLSSTIKNKKFIAMHNAWSYFADHYGLTLVGTYEPVEGKQPTIDDLENLRTIIENNTLHTFYAEPQKASSAATRFLHDDFGLTISVLDPVGGLEGRESYEKLMLFNMHNLLEGQQ